MLKHFVISIGLGIAVSAPIGSIGTLCIRQCLINGRMMGILSGLACGLADGVYAAIAAFGFSAVSDYLIEHMTIIQLVGIAALIINGIILFRDKINHLKLETTPISHHHKCMQLLSLFFITVINPATVIAIPAIMAASGLLSQTLTAPQAWGMVLGMITGTCIWWTCMAILICKNRHRFNNQLLLKLNHITGVILCLGATAIAINLIIPNTFSNLLI